MHDPLIPALLVLILPALYLAHRKGWLASRWGRWIAALVTIGIVAWSAPWHGVELDHVKHVNMLLALAAGGLLLLRHQRVPWTRDAARWQGALLCLAGLAAVNFTNYSAFHGHGTRAFIHLHDVAHYYLGSKYYAELGYTDLYTAMLRAEAEVYDDHFRAIEARDLETYDPVHIRTLLQRSGPVKARFSEERWQDFLRDVTFFRERLNGEQYGRLLLDHGFNPTPVWALVGGFLANLVPAGSHHGLLSLTLLDPLLLILLFAAVARTFGLETTLLAATYFCIVFGGTFGWVGGGFLRYPWLFALVTAVCCLQRLRFATAGALVALATCLRVFPIVFAVPLALKALILLWRRRTLPSKYRRLAVSFAATTALLVLSTALLPRDTGGFLGPWQDFRANMSNHLENIAPNVVGLTEALAFQRAGGEVTVDEFRQLKERRQGIYRAQFLIVFLPVLVAVAWLASRRSDLQAVLLAFPLLYTGLSLAAYYYACLMLLVLGHRRSSRNLALIFTVEAVPYVLRLFEEREALLFIYRGLSLVFLFLALELGGRKDRIQAQNP